MKKYLLLSLAVCAFNLVSAQKFGYVNSQELLVSLPQIKTADTEIEAYQKTLMDKGQKMVTEFETEYKAYMEEANKGLLSKVQMQQKEEVLTGKQQAIQSYEQDVQTQLTVKRESLYKPILDKVTNTIKSYGKTNGYTLIFDSSTGNILHALDSDNLFEQIKAEILKTN
jgi:outer membrane protein